MAHPEVVEIQQLEEELEENPENGPARAQALLQLANTLYRRAIRDENIEEFERAIQLVCDIPEKTIVADHLRRQYYTLLPEMYLNKYRLTSAIGDLEPAVQSSEKTLRFLQARNERDLILKELLRLTTLYKEKHDRSPTATDLAAATRHVRQAFTMLSEDHGDADILQLVNHLPSPPIVVMIASYSSWGEELEALIHILDDVTSMASHATHAYIQGHLRCLQYSYTRELSYLSDAHNAFKKSVQSQNLGNRVTSYLLPFLRKYCGFNERPIHVLSLALFTQIALEDVSLEGDLSRLGVLQISTMLYLMMWIQTGHIDHLRSFTLRQTEVLNHTPDERLEKIRILKEIAMGNLMIYQQTQSVEHLDMSLRMLGEVVSDTSVSQQPKNRQFWGLWNIQDLDVALSRIEAVSSRQAVIQKLRKKDINRHLQYRGEDPPLHLAVALGHIAPMRWLVEYGGSDVNEKVKDKGTPLHVAASTGRVDAARYLIQMGSDMNALDKEDVNTPFLSALQGQSADMLHFLIDQGANIEKADLSKALLPACAMGNEGLAEMIYTMGGSLDSLTGNTPIAAIMSGILNRHVNIIRLLLKWGLDVQNPSIGGQALGAATLDDNVEMIECLLQGKMDVNVEFQQRSVLYWAAREGCQNAARVLLANGADTTKVDHNWVSTLSIAANGGHVEIVKSLLEHGANTRTLNKLGWTPLMSACMSQRSSIVAMILAQDKSIIGIASHYGMTPLSVSCQYGDIVTIKLLLEAEADPSISDKFGRNSLVFARRRGGTEAAELLIESARSRGIALDEDKTTQAERFSEEEASLKACHVCVFPIPKKAAYYECSLCYTRALCICKDCFSLGAYCLDSAHSLSSCIA